MQILFIAPYPPSRIHVRAYGIVQSLAREHTVTILTQVTSRQELHDKEVLERQGYRVIAVAASKPRALARCALALLGREPLQVAYARSSPFLRMAQQLCDQQHFDVVHVEHLRGIASMEPLAQQYPLVWDAVDCITHLWQQTAVAGHSLALRSVAFLEQGRTARYEGRLVGKLAHITAISEEDAEALRGLARQQDQQEERHTVCENIEIVPNGIDLDYFCVQPCEYRRYNLVFSGKMSYHANVAAVHYLYREIMPLIWRVQPAATLTIVGSRPPKSIQRLAADRRVEVTGFVEDIRPYIRHAHVVVCPTVYSVGQQNKALEAMALGAAVIVSAQSASSLQAEANKDLLIAQSAEEFAQHVLHLFNDERFRKSLGENARTYVERSHDWSVITKRLVSFYREAAGASVDDRDGVGVPLVTSGVE
jgi:sugar transferase (PEP-CTERM/EpsH1 system associated)